MRRVAPLGSSSTRSVGEGDHRRWWRGRPHLGPRRKAREAPPKLKSLENPAPSTAPGGPPPSRSASRSDPPPPRIARPFEAWPFSSPFSPCGRRWPREAGSDEGSTHLSGGARRRSAEGWSRPLIRPPSAATFSRKGRRESRAPSAETDGQGGRRTRLGDELCEHRSPLCRGGMRSPSPMPLRAMEEDQFAEARVWKIRVGAGL
jgi:hypothetical protein